MKKGGLILFLGLCMGAAAFAGFYYLGTAPSRHLMEEPQPELAWLKKEFNLSDADYRRITALHEAYLPQCAERCRVIEQQNTKLRELLAANPVVTPEIQALLLDRARTRAQCEAEMLKHFEQVGRSMPAAQGRRYLAWVREQTVLRAQAMESRHKAESSEPVGGHHH